MPYFMNNRKKFVQKLNEIFADYRIKDNDTNDISCDQLKNSDTGSLLLHQKVVRDYLNLYTPYRGILLYHSLGAGKSFSSIAIAEGFKSEKRIFVFLPASLKTNYWTEIAKYGDPLFKRNQYWEFVSIFNNENIISILAKALQISTDEVKKRKGAWMVDINKPSNFNTLSSENQAAIDIQIQEMINNKYKNIHYNANNLNSIIKTMIQQINGGNPFDHSVIIIDEAHNFVSKIVNKLKTPASIYFKLYHLLMDATDCRIVMLSGTPILNYPNEMGVMFNLLRGYIKTWEFKVTVSTTKEISQKTIIDILEKEGLQTYDFIQYSNNKLIITRNPFGFIHYNDSQNEMKKPIIEIRKTKKNIEVKEKGNDKKRKLHQKQKKINNLVVLVLKCRIIKVWFYQKIVIN